MNKYFLRICLLALLSVAGIQHSNARKGWVDVTDKYLLSPRFDGNSNYGWTWASNAHSQAVRCEAMEFWNGTWDLWQTISNLPAGEYRLSVQSYYRCGDNSWAFNDYCNGTETITGMMYAGSTEKQLVSVYSYHFPESYIPSGCWGGWDYTTSTYYYFPNSMESGTEAFALGAYQNEMTFTHEGGDLQLGLRNENQVESNWCLFDNFRLEAYLEIVPVSRLTIIPNELSFVVGQQQQLNVDIQPTNATITDLIWESSNSQVVSVDQHGVVTAQAEGTATITAKATDGSGCSAQAKVTVERNPVTKESLIVNEVMASNVDEWISPAYNFDGWVELYNPTEKPVELGGIYVSDDRDNLKKWHTPATLGAIPAKGFFTMWFDSNDVCQTNAPFKLDVDGGTLFFSDTKGKLIVSQDYPASLPRVSYARLEDGGKQWGTTSTPTPGNSNNGSIFASEQLAPPTVNQPSKMFTGRLNVSVDIPAGCTLRYTTDGTLPTLDHGETSKTGQFTISETSLYRFRLFADGYLPSTTTTRSYIYRNTTYSLPIVSVVSDPRFLYDNTIGVYVQGSNGRPGNGQKSPCNWNMNWERPVNFSFITKDGEMALNQDVNLEMCGGWSRAWTPHSFKLKGSKELGGSKKLPYPFFKEKPYINNRTLQIRNGGNDTNCRIKDPAIQTIVQTSGIDIDGQSYLPVHEFINGEYIGVLNVREPNNKHYVYANYGWDDDEIDLFEISPDSFYVQKCGTPDAYHQLVELSAYAADPNVYAQIKNLLNIDEYINYMAAEFYLGGGDWTRNNVKAFRHRDGGRFRFVMFDTDSSFGLGENMFWNFLGLEYNYRFDLLYPSNTYLYIDNTLVTLFRQLLQNDQFRRQFIDTYCMMGGSVFEPSRSNAIIDELSTHVVQAMSIEGRSPNNTANDVKNSLRNREEVMTRAIKNFDAFNLSSVAAQPVTLSSDTEDARIEVNGVNIPTGQFKGHLFAPVKLKAVAPAGHQFLGWREGTGNMQEIIGLGSSWYYYDQGDLGRAGWYSDNYSTDSWKSGNAPLGYGMNGVKTTISYGSDSRNKIPTYYFRKSITLDKKPAGNARFQFNYRVDDGFVLYVNGTEAGRYNMPPGAPSYNTYTTTWAGSVPDEGSITLPSSLFRLGKNNICVEVHNTSGSSSDIFFDASLFGELTDDQHVNYLFTDDEIDLPAGSVNLVACYRKMTQQELAEAGFHPVCINEISAANSIFVNEYGKKNDWIELYNLTDEEQDVGGMYLSDKKDDLKKYQIPLSSSTNDQPSTIISPHGRLIIWCDKLETTSQAIHTNFKLDAEGGMVALSAANMSWTDQLYYGALNGNQTIGRYPDGAQDIFLMTVPTIAKANLLSCYDEAINQKTLDVSERLVASSGGLRITVAGEALLLHDDEASYAHVNIMTVSGQTVDNAIANMHSGRSRVSVAHLPAGVYIAHATSNNGNTVSCKFVIK